MENRYIFPRLRGYAGKSNKMTDCNYQNTMAMEIAEWIAQKSGKSIEEVTHTEVLEMALAKFCLRLGAKTITQGDITKIAQHASWIPCHHNVCPGWIVIKYDSLSLVQCTEMAKLLNNDEDKQVDVLEESAQSTLLKMPISRLYELDLFSN